MNIQERLTAFAMLGAGWVMWLLVILSVICLAIVLERAYYLFATRGNVDELRRELMKRLKAGDTQGAEKMLGASKAVEARIVHAALEGDERSPEVFEERLAGAALTARLAMERNLAFLGTVGNNAPFLGLLGTVIGVIRAFQALEEGAGQVTSGLMAEIGEALVATAIGILVALPAVAFFNLFQRVVRARLARADSLGREILALFRSETAAQASGHTEAAE